MGSPHTLLLIRALLILVFCTSQSTGILAETHPHETPDCFTRLAQEKLVGDSVTVLTIDSTVVRGIRPIVNLTSSILYMRSVTDSGIGGSVSVPFDRINRIMYRRPSSARGIITLLGFGVGWVAGVIAVVALMEGSDPFDFKSWDLDLIGLALSGGLIGGSIGAVGGHAIGKRITVSVTLECM